MTQGDGAPKKTLDQRRADHAWNKITAAKQLDREGSRDYAGEAKKLPVRIMASGLGQALAFIQAKAKKRRALDQLHQDLTDWVIGQRLGNGSTDGGGRADSNRLLYRVIHGDSDFLRRATDESLAYLLWLNRFAEAEGLTDESETAGGER